AEKFFDIKCVSAGLEAAAVVLVATLRALKLHGEAPLNGLDQPNEAALARGLPNLEKHIENIQAFGESPVVALNRFSSDRESEVELVRTRCRELRVPFAVTDHFARGGEGALDLARVVLAHARGPTRPFRPLYHWTDPVPDKIRAVARSMYGARDVSFTSSAQRDLEQIERLGYGPLPVCIAKTQNSLSDDPHRRGRPTGFDVTVRRIQINAGAGFLVVLTGEILRMPGLPQQPLAERIDLKDGAIVGLR
ncbi:MAG TPA: formate--tetrahydrofolate ligase, partial [Myxococcota bacterium]|nr:formate--tetrahydrofolate ligase [Myxococcota bacterium]